MSYIYLIEAGGYHKIGWANNVTRRVGQMSLPFHVTVLHTFQVDDVKLCENWLLTCFKSKQVRGEWFIFSPDDIAAICSLTDLDSCRKLYQSVLRREYSL